MKSILILTFTVVSALSFAQGDMNIKKDRKCYEKYDAEGNLIPKKSAALCGVGMWEISRSC